MVKKSRKRQRRALQHSHHDKAAHEVSGYCQCRWSTAGDMPISSTNRVPSPAFASQRRPLPEVRDFGECLLFAGRGVGSHRTHGLPEVRFGGYWSPFAGRGVGGGHALRGARCWLVATFSCHNTGTTSDAEFGQFGQRADFDAAVLKARMAGGDLLSLGLIASENQVVSAEHLTRLGVGTIGDQPLAVTNAH